MFHKAVLYAVVVERCSSFLRFRTECVGNSSSTKALLSQYKLRYLDEKGRLNYLAWDAALDVHRYRKMLVMIIEK